MPNERLTLKQIKHIILSILFKPFNLMALGSPLNNKIYNFRA
ncbi:hypothetical protein VCRA2116O141_200018 [Vibrio crassostreae]|nr:hypothetical protein VCRA2116O141_200018 [Vibrio crassostreae]